MSSIIRPVGLNGSLSKNFLKQLKFLASKSTTTTRGASSAGNVNSSKNTFDPKMLDILACPLSKKPLRFDETNQELICDELGVAYPIVGGIPDLNPYSGRMIKSGTESASKSTEPKS